MSFCGIQAGKGFRLRTSLVLSSADDAGSFKIKLGEISASSRTPGIQGDGFLEFRPDFLGEARGGEEAD